MSTGALLLPPGYHPLIDGAVVPSGKIYFYRTGTTTAQDTFTDADLAVANSNPVVLNATGGLDTLVYGDPTTGFRYRMRIYSSADALLDTHDDLLVFGADVETISEGSFTGTLTGMSGATTGTVNYIVQANAAGTGKICTLYCSAAIQGTSNTTAMTMTGVPAACQPAAIRWVIGGCMLADNGAQVRGEASVTAGTVTFYTDEPPSATGFTGSGTKGTLQGTTLSYPL